MKIFAVVVAVVVSQILFVCFFFTMIFPISSPMLLIVALLSLLLVESITLRNTANISPTKEAVFHAQNTNENKPVPVIYTTMANVGRCTG